MYSNSQYQKKQVTDKRKTRQNQGTDTFLIHDISIAIILEHHAYHFYQKLAELADNEQQRRVILNIQRDEARHYRWFTMILRSLGGEQPEIPAGEEPDSFAEGIKAAIDNERIAEAFYEDIAWRAVSHHIKMHFTRAARDEQRHAALFQSMQAN